MNSRFKIIGTVEHVENSWDQEKIKGKHNKVVLNLETVNHKEQIVCKQFMSENILLYCWEKYKNRVKALLKKKTIYPSNKNISHSIQAIINFWQIVKVYSHFHLWGWDRNPDSWQISPHIWIRISSVFCSAFSWKSLALDRSMWAVEKAGPHIPLQPFKIYTTQWFSLIFSQYFCCIIQSHKKKSCIFDCFKKPFIKILWFFPHSLKEVCFSLSKQLELN